MVEAKKKADCCGCSACHQICPKHCIQMDEDVEGFLYPSVNKELCINCGLCEKVCPIVQMEREKCDTEIVTSYIAYLNNEKVREESSSGGIFSSLCEWVVKNGGVVFGAAYDENFMVHHIVVSDQSELWRLRGSKYTQSRIENSYLKAKQYLEDDRIVLFSGTGCQISGLQGYLGKEYSNLFLVDVLCHGVPTPKLWELYLTELKEAYKSDISKVNLRNKDTGWKNYSVEIEFTNNQVYKQKHSQDAYIRLFLSNICLRPSCYNCHFKNFPRVSDITLGDCWGVQNYSPEMDDDNGTSIVIINSERGKALWNMINNTCTWKASDLDTILPISADSRKSVTAHWNRPLFFDSLNVSEGINDLLRTIEPSVIERIKHKLKKII